MPAPLITTAQRRARLGLRHSLATRAETVDAAVGSVVCLHATDPATVYLSAAARLTNPSLDRMADALYQRRSVIRFHAMRGTMFVAAVDDVPHFEAAASRDVATSERRRLEKMLADSGIDDPAAWIEEVAVQLVDALADEGLPARALTRRVPALSRKLIMAKGTKNETEIGTTSRVLRLLATEGILVRGSPTGRWTSRQYEWHLRANWIEPTDGPTDGRESRSWLAEAWLRRFGPGTVEDLQWWTGWNKTRVTKALESLDVIEVTLGEGQGYVMADDIEEVRTPAPWAALLPALDATPMGWKQRDWFLGGHDDALFDRFGNIGPTVWVDGRIVGGWGQQPTGAVISEVLEPITRDEAALIEAEVSRVQRLVETTQVRPSFSTPLQRRLAESG
jgi:hypothetical protein